MVWIEHFFFFFFNWCWLTTRSVLWREAAQRAIQMLDNYKVRPGKFIGVCVSLDNCRLFLGSIPKEKMKDEVLAEMKKVSHLGYWSTLNATRTQFIDCPLQTLPVCAAQLTDGVVDVIMYPSSTDKSKNRGFAFVEYKSHKAAAMARRKLIPGTEPSSVWAVCLPALFTICAFYFWTYICVSSGLVPPWLYYRNFSAVGPGHSSGLGPAREGCGRGSYAAGQSPLCKSADDTLNDEGATSADANTC